jgi:hypothetical protein
MLFAGVLACHAIWVLLAEWYRPALPGFPVDAHAAEALVAQRDAAASAASYGIMRGDLWAENALTYANILWDENGPSPNGEDTKTIGRVRDIADRALTLDPYDAGTWLVLAGVELQFRPIDQKMAAAAIRMSYYTGPNETKIIPLRLHLAVRSEALADKDFQQLVRHDIRVIVTRNPDLKAAILSAFAHAPPAGQQFVRQTLMDLDPSLLSKLGSKG